MKKFGKIFLSFLFSFPVQLFLLNLKKHPLLIIFWLFLFGIVTGSLGSTLGLHYLFLDPEYLGQVNFLSFFLVGIAFGGFFVTWNITSYILNSYRFPFLAALGRPFTKYCLNNFVIPIGFFVVYITALVNFQIQSEETSFTRLFFNISGLISGFTIMIVLIFTYFFQTNKDIFGLLGLKREEEDEDIEYKKVSPKSSDTEDMSLEKKILLKKGWRVDNYLSHTFRLRRVRSTEHYDGNMLRSVFRQNHRNALILELIAFVVLIILGRMMGNAYFRIPASASVLLVFSILSMLSGALGFWLRGWRTFAFLFIFFLFNYLIEIDIIKYKHQAFGMDYNATPVKLDNEMLRRISSDQNVAEDHKRTLKMLEKWKSKFDVSEIGGKPKMIFINVSGGGLRSALWTMKVLAMADSALEGNLMKHSVMITGASGGMIGAAYYRSLYLEKLRGKNVDPTSSVYAENMSKDLLNAIAFVTSVNDLFTPFNTFQLDGYKYSADRGYAFELQLNDNTDHVMNHTLADFAPYEENLSIPMVVMTPVIINNAKTLVISSQPVSYLTRPLNHNNTSTSKIDGIEFSRLFNDNNASNLRFVTALRMNATFPYIMPNVVLPTDPPLEVMDAGMRDNFGTETTIRFLHQFNDWIAENTSGVIVMQIRDTPKKSGVKQKDRTSVLGKMLNPIGNFYVNWQEYQDAHRNNLIGSVGEWFEGNIDFVTFQYISKDPRKRAVLSWHLTTQEKLNISETTREKENLEELTKVVSLMNQVIARKKNLSESVGKELTEELHNESSQN